MTRRDPIPELNRQLGAALAQLPQRVDINVTLELVTAMPLEGGALAGSTVALRF